MHVTVTLHAGPDTHDIKMDIDDLARFRSWIMQYRPYTAPQIDMIMQTLASSEQPMSRRQIAAMLRVTPRSLESNIKRLRGGESSKGVQQPRRIHVAGWIRDDHAGGRWCRLFAIGGDKPDADHPTRDRQYAVSEQWQHLKAAPKEDAVTIAKRHLGNPFAGLIK